MKRNIKYIIGCVISMVTLFACTSDDFYMEDIKSNQRSILSVKVPDQIGPHEIVRTDDESRVIVYVKPGIDLTAVKTNIQVSSKARISPSPSEPYNFAANKERVFVVTSETGQQSEWIMELREYVFDLFGTWNVTNAQFFYNVGEEYGKPEEWNDTKPLWNPMPGAQAITDNTIVFDLQGATPQGNIHGAFIHNAGPDEKHASYIYKSEINETDFAYKFGKLPRKNGTWMLNLSDNTITFNMGESDQSVSLPIEWNANKTVLMIPFSPGPKDLVWDNDWNRIEIQSSKRYWFTLVKQ